MSTDVLDMTRTMIGEMPLEYAGIRYEIEAISINTLITDRELYRRPNYQRHYTWDLKEAYSLIRSLLLGQPIHGLQVVLRRDPYTGRAYYNVMDGLSRKETLELFVDGKIRTPTAKIIQKLVPNSRVPVIQPNRRFDQLTEATQDRIKRYKIPVTTMYDVPEEWEPDFFEAFQSGRKLKLGQRLWARGTNSKLGEAARSLMDHVFWRDVYRINRRMNEDIDRIRFLAAVTMLCLENTSYPFRTSLRDTVLNEWSSGVYDEKVNVDWLVARVEQRMVDLAHVFVGSECHTRCEAIAVYQAGLLLEHHGFDLLHSQRGCLTPWMQKTRIIRQHGNAKNAYGIISHLPYYETQLVFWKEHEPSLRHAIPGLVKASQVDEAYLAELATSGV